MNFDDIKSAWNKDSGSNVTVPNKIEQLKRAELPLDKIKRNMRNEFWMQVFSIILIAFVPQIFKFKPALTLPFHGMYILLLLTSVYFFARFYGFYRRIGNVALNTKDALYEVHYDIKLNMELYKMFCYMLFPFVFLFVGLYAMNQKYEYFITLWQSGISTAAFYLYFGLGTIIIYALLHLAAVSWLNSYYAKYAKEIEALLKQLRED